MDDLARAAGLSRQGLYLHFPTKEALFHAAVQHLIGKVRVALDRDVIDLAHRFTGALDARCGDTTAASSASVAELLATATTPSGPLLEQLRHDVVAAMARSGATGSPSAGRKSASPQPIWPSTCSSRPPDHASPPRCRAAAASAAHRGAHRPPGLLGLNCERPLRNAFSVLRKEFPRVLPHCELGNDHLTNRTSVMPV
ncbi:TetR/AcrR family transcriptional regulator [Nocardia farcinica]|nr:TetR/AcrR family transcriptional regulator [Nocardia farcinica]MBF6283564.1 TetR/AcrR family transcriptional regulator [Nocardia farcinica]MBF6307483.1 TetR/AcrR family transcriptional regulator [Nocardia farcinica]MBF6392449.1 TetR/AcrR family transcriptional regulator [Nocardia farcinica]MBF6490462.1 TetR/AcrR family transcriptional regulator [Nocardia farcinica]